MIPGDLQDPLAFFLTPAFVVVRVTQALLRKRGASFRRQVLWPVALTPLVYEASILSLQGHADALLPVRLAVEALSAGLLALLFARSGPAPRTDRGARPGPAAPTPPLILFESACCEMRLYETLEEALVGVEPSDVEYADVFGFDAQGRPLNLFVNAEGQVGIEAAFGPARSEDFERTLRQYLEGYGERLSIAPGDIAALVAHAAERHTEKPIGRPLRQVLGAVIARIWTRLRGSAKPRG